MNLFDRFVSLCGDKDKNNEALEYMVLNMMQVTLYTLSSKMTGINNRE